eukprot:jgi/Chrzof1/8780/Cz03g24090.t1
MASKAGHLGSRKETGRTWQDPAAPDRNPGGGGAVLYCTDLIVTDSHQPGARTGGLEGGWNLREIGGGDIDFAGKIFAGRVGHAQQQRGRTPVAVTTVSQV